MFSVILLRLCSSSFCTRQVPISVSNLLNELTRSPVFSFSHFCETNKEGLSLSIKQSVISIGNFKTFIDYPSIQSLEFTQISGNHLSCIYFMAIPCFGKIFLDKFTEQLSDIQQFLLETISWSSNSSNQLFSELISILYVSL
jgi:hypothetical protein